MNRYAGLRGGLRLESHKTRPFERPLVVAAPPDTAVLALDGTSCESPEAFATAMRGRTLDAIAGIGEPKRFFDLLAAIGVSARPHPLGDHASVDPAWLATLPGERLIMTEKDAVKCTGFDAALLARCVALRIEAVPDAALIDWLEERLRG
jgi:tetraacyldisaccharide 4'-kinase